MPRDSGGTYSLPAGNPVTTLTVISSTWANTTLSDISTALTGSLDRSGQGAMLAGLKLFDGTIGAPGLTWGTETTAGIYRNAAGDFRFAIGGADVFRFATGGSLGLFGNGAVGAPSISWGSEPTSGFYRAGAADFRYALGGVDFIQWTTNLESISGTGPARRWNETDASANNRLWGIQALGEDLLFQATTDALVSTNWMIVSRTAGVVDSVAINSVVTLPKVWASLEPALLISSTLPAFQLNETDGAAGNQRWMFSASGEQLLFSTRADNDSAGVTWLTVERTGTTVDSVNFNNGTLQYGGLEVGYRNLAFRTFSTSDSTTAADADKSAYFIGGAGQTFTLDNDPADTAVFTILNTGTSTLTIAPGGGMSLNWYNGAGSVVTGSRTLAIGGVCTAHKPNSSGWNIWGVGLS